MKEIKHNNSDKKFIELIESMPIDEARHSLVTGEFGQPNSPNYTFVSSLISAKESKLRDSRDNESLSISRKALSNSRMATRIAISAIILSIIMAIKEIIDWYSKQ